MAHTPAPADPPRASGNTLVVRVRSALLIGIPAVGLGILGGAWFAGLALVAVIVSAVEVVRLMNLNALKPPLVFTCAWTALAFVAVRAPGPLAGALFSVLLLGSLAWQMRLRQGLPIADWAIALASGAYLGWAGGCLSAVREFDQGLAWLALAAVPTWAADSGAYFTGRRFGKHRLAPSLSPKKTWEGYIGGVCCALLAGLVIGLAAPAIGLLHGVLTATLVGLLGTLGDLTESMFKRQANAKDSGHLIPGHGGVFDRIDSLLWAGIVVFLYASYLFPLAPIQ